MQQLPLQIVFLNDIEIGDPQGPNPGGGQIERGRAAQSTGPDDQYLGGGEFLLPGHTHFLQQDLTTVAAQGCGIEIGRLIWH